MGSTTGKLFDAVEGNSIEKLHKVLYKNPELLNAPLGKDLPYNCLIRASWRGSLDMVKYLIEERKADINMVVNGGKPALMVAAEQDYPKVVRYLSKQEGIDLNYVDKFGYNALDNAIAYGCYKSALVLKKRVSCRFLIFLDF